MPQARPICSYRSCALSAMIQMRSRARDMYLWLKLCPQCNSSTACCLDGEVQYGFMWSRHAFAERLVVLCRWMAPEVVEHGPYNHQADVYSFAIVLWELLTGQVPYADKTPLQAAVGVVQKGLRPPIPASCPPALAMLMQECWGQKPADRPSFQILKHRRDQCRHG